MCVLDCQMPEYLISFN